MVILIPRFCLALLVAAAMTGASHAISLFQVGNSFTFDSLGFNTDFQPIGTQAMLEADLGEPVELGYHVRGNQTLDSLWSNPTGGGTYSGQTGDHTVALPGNAWDYLALQTFPSDLADPGPTLGEELARIQDFVSAADLGGGGATQVIIHGPWAGRGESAWQDWYHPAIDDPATETCYAAAYHDLLYDKVEAIYPGRVRLASAGKVIREVRDRIANGDAPIAATSQLYRDAIHMSRLGTFVASTTMQTSILGRSAVGQPVARDVPGWSISNVSDRQARWAQLTAWEVLLADPRSGVLAPASGDYDGNGVINYSDLSVYHNSYGSSERLLADGNGNGVIDDGDLVVWQDAVTLAGGLDPVAGDYDGNGVIDRADLGLLQFDYGATNRSYVDGNNDGFVDAADYTVWRDAFAAATAATAVPEPAGLAVALIAVGLLVPRRSTV